MTMTKFGIDKDFDSAKGDIGKTGRTLELLKTDKDEYSLMEHHGDNVEGLTTFTYEELKTLWRMITVK
jgi:hypothetical protein